MVVLPKVTLNNQFKKKKVVKMRDKLLFGQITVVPMVCL